MNRLRYRRPLAGTRVVVTRAKEQAQDLVARLTRLGADVLAVPTIQIRDPSNWREVDVALKELESGTYEWVVFPSVNSARKVLERAGDATLFNRTKVAAIGSSTAAALRDWGIRADLVPDSFEGQALARALGPGRGRLLLPRVEGAPRALVEGLAEHGWRVDEVEAYRNVLVRSDDHDFRSVRLGDFDILTFTSPSTVRNFARVVPPEGIGVDPESDGSHSVACIGPSTAAAARATGVRVDIVAAQHTVEGLVEAVCALKDASIGK